MGDGRNVLDHVDLKTCRLQRTDCGLTASAGTLNINFYNTHAVLHGSLGSLLRSHLSREGSALPGTAEAAAAGGSPGDRVAVKIGDRNERVVERGTDMSLAALDVLLLAALAAGNLLTFYLLSHLSLPPYFFLLI